VKAKAAQTLDFPDGIPECGADALRFGLLAYTVQGRDVNLDIKRVVGYRQFCNKIWNAFKFTMTYVKDFTPFTGMLEYVLQSAQAQPRDLWILSRLNATIADTDNAIASYLFGNATSALHAFFLYDVCDVYLEISKPVFADTSAENAEQVKITQATLYVILDTFLRLTHPLMPFLTEELWQRLPQRKLIDASASIMIASYPQPSAGSHSAAAERSMELVKDTINGARSLRADYKIANHIKVDYYFRTESEEVRDTLLKQSTDFCTLARGNGLLFLGADKEAPKGCCVKVLNENLSLLVDLTGVIDVETEITRLTKEIER
jgi:valyl-tRNA synthetase